MYELILRSAHLSELINRAMSTKEEVCGFLIGRKLSAERHFVESIYWARNVSKSPSILFEISPEEVFEAYETAESRGLGIVCVFHSHPAPPRPSPRDMSVMSYWRIPWLIIDGRSGSVGVFVLTEDGRLIEVHLTII